MLKMEEGGGVEVGGKRGERSRATSRADSTE